MRKLKQRPSHAKPISESGTVHCKASKKKLSFIYIYTLFENLNTLRGRTHARTFWRSQRSQISKFIYATDAQQLNDPTRIFLHDFHENTTGYLQYGFC